MDEAVSSIRPRSDELPAAPSKPFSPFSALTAADSRRFCIPDHELIQPIASGSYGEVWLARNAVGTLRAVKIVRRQTFEKDTHYYEREFKGLEKFEPISRSHPGLINILHLGRNDSEGYFYYVMELADDASSNVAADTTASGSRMNPPPRLISDPAPCDPPLVQSEPHVGRYIPRTLRHELTARGALPFDECLSIAQTLASALEYLHKHNLVHRDIKPSNIVFVNGTPKLADIGLVALMDEAVSAVGTHGFIPPEGPGKLQGDIYSFGKVVYQALFGKAPEDYPSFPAEVLLRPDHMLVLELNEVIGKACAHDFRCRYTSAVELCADLQLLRRGASVKRRDAIRRLITRSTKIFLVVAVALAVWFSVSRLQTPRSAPVEERWSSNEKANQAFRSGRRTFHQNSRGSFGNAAADFEHAIALDPNFARAYARLAHAYFWMDTTGSENLAKAHRLAKKALALDPNSYEAHLALGAITAGFNLDSEAAEKHDKMAISLNPRSDEAYFNYAAFLAVMGRTNAALDQVKKAERLGSTSFIGLQYAAFTYEAAREYHQVIRLVSEHIAKDSASKAGLTLRFLVPAWRELGEYRKSIELEKEAALLSGQDPAETEMKFAALLEAFRSGGPRAYWEQRLAWCKNDVSKPLLLTSLFARIGETNAALDHLELAFAKSPAQVRFNINRDPAFDSVRHSPRFQAIRRKLKMEP